ncbi:acidic fibroblast growth factor intracellular-binding protein [Dermatophagoides pteronyssinus]|uniref:acidic fibroblast growth factor intracellular-binding protein n=1 Tax=Dermatophagoides pteronyssinus TaxID=6956 RepID=UPI003F66E812
MFLPCQCCTKFLLFDGYIFIYIFIISIIYIDSGIILFQRKSSPSASYTTPTTTATKMFTEVDVFIGNNTLIDPKIYDYWLDGYPAQHAAKEVREKDFTSLNNVHEDLIISYVLDQYRTFQMLEKLLHIPIQLSEQWTFQMTPVTQQMLIEKYYDFKDAVVREILGKKLSARNRKELDEVSERTEVSIKSCRRQFDNIKRVFKMVEDIPGNLCQNIQSHFLLPPDLAKKYAAIVYISNNRFETSKRKLQYLHFNDFLHCSLEIMNNWSCNNPDCKYEETSMDIDREFLHELRDLRTLLEKDNLEEHRLLVLRMLKPNLTEKKYNDIDSAFKNISRNIINIAYGLNHSKEIRDLFLDIVEKIIELFKAIKFNQAETILFLRHYKESPQFIESFKSNRNLLKVWDRFITTFNSCVLKMYH